MLVTLRYKADCCTVVVGVCANCTEIMHTQKNNFVAFFSKETATIVLECQSSLQEKKEDANMVEEERTLEENGTIINKE